MEQRDDTGLTFMKMHGLGNDFVVLDARKVDVLDARKVDALDAGVQGGLDERSGRFGISAALIAALADRHRGVGFDQLAVISDPDAPAADAHLTFYNADGSGSAACGNATRCIARHLFDESGATALTLTTDRGALAVRDAGGGMTSVNMGQPQTAWQDIPLARPVDTLHLPIEGTPVGTGMGNPHCTFFVADIKAVDLPAFGARIEHHPLFPERTNVQIAEITGPERIRMRVWERGVGITLASGSSSCAVAVAAARRGHTGRRVEVTLDGGTLLVDWRDDGVWMTGASAHVFTGVLTPAFLAAL